MPRRCSWLIKDRCELAISNMTNNSRARGRQNEEDMATRGRELSEENRENAMMK